MTPRFLHTRIKDDATVRKDQSMGLVLGRPLRTF